jgi:lipopolysaccharide heptosyltransferase III
MLSERRPNLIIFRIGSLGDTIVALPCFHAIARAFPGHRKVLLTDSINSARASPVEIVLEGTGFIDEAIYFSADQGRVNRFIVIGRQLRELAPELLVYLAPRTAALQVHRDLLFFRMAGISRVIGAPLGIGARECRTDLATGQLEYEAERLARTLGGAIPVDLTPASWDLRLAPKDFSTAMNRMSGLPSRQPVVALSPGARISAKDWGEERWGALIRLLELRMPDVSLVFFGSSDEQPLASRLAQLWTGAKLNLCGELSPRESAAALGRCDLLVCHDSGPMHLAASRGTRCVALFGNYNRPRQWFPYGPDHVVIYEPRGVRHIDVEHVVDSVEAAVRALDATSTYRGVRAANSVSYSA